MRQEDLQRIIHELWEDVRQHHDFSSAAEAIDLQSKFGQSGSVRENVLQPGETGEQALKKILDTLIGWYDDWRICCHEAGHAIVAIKLRMPVQRILRGERMKGSVRLEHHLDLEDHDNQNERAKYAKFYAAGAAAERIIFGTEPRTFDCIVDPLKDDKQKHQNLEWRQSDAFEADLLAAVAILEPDDGKNHIEKVATLLRERRDENGKEGHVTEEEVADITGDKLY